MPLWHFPVPHWWIPCKYSTTEPHPHQQILGKCLPSSHILASHWGILGRSSTTESSLQLLTGGSQASVLPLKHVSTSLGDSRKVIFHGAILPIFYLYIYCFNFEEITQKSRKAFVRKASCFCLQSGIPGLCWHIWFKFLKTAEYINYPPSRELLRTQKVFYFFQHAAN